MIIFKRSKVVDDKTSKLNNLLLKALDINHSNGKIIGLPNDITLEDKEKLDLVIYQAFELIRQLKEARVFSKKRVHEFVNENHKWVDKKSIEKLISLGLYQLVVKE